MTWSTPNPDEQLREWSPEQVKAIAYRDWELVKIGGNPMTVHFVWRYDEGTDRFYAQWK